MLRCSAKQFLASDYDTICVVDIEGRNLMRSARLQAAEPSNYRLFVGDYDLGEAGEIIVARPFSADVVKLDANLMIVDQVAVSGQPLAICLMSEGQFLTRDWKTGEATVGTFPSSHH